MLLVSQALEPQLQSTKGLPSLGGTAGEMSLQNRLHVIRYRSPSVLDRLMLDEALFRDPLKRLWLVLDDSHERREDVSIVLGMSGKLEEVNEQAARSDDVKLIRRFSGGGTVAVDRNAFLVSLIANASQIVPSKSVPPYPREIMRWTDERVYRPAFHSVKRSPDMVFSSRENDYVINEHFKVGGNAQGISGDRFCHHTSFLIRVNPKTMSYLRMPKKRPEYRQDRDHTSFLRGLEDEIYSPDALYDKVAEHFAVGLGLRYPQDVVIDDPRAEIPAMLKESRNVIL